MTQLPKKTEQNDDPRRRQLIVGLSILGLLILLVPAFHIVWHFIPGLFGEWLGVIAGVISTPFLLEVFFIICGFVMIVTLNQIRQRCQGDEFVYLEQIDDSSVSADLPDHSKFAIYRDRPLPGIEPAPVDEIEGALEIGDHAHVAYLLADMAEEELKTPAVLALRLRLARETGKDDLAHRIERELESRKPQ